MTTRLDVRLSIKKGRKSITIRENLIPCSRSFDNGICQEEEEEEELMQCLSEGVRKYT